MTPDWHPARKSMSMGPKPKPHGRGRWAFTLLELLIASFLLGFVVLAVWSLAGVYGRLLEATFHRVEQAQVVRAVVEQLRADLRHAIQDPVAGIRQPRPGGAPVRRFGLWGTARDLRLDVLQPVDSLAGVGISEAVDETLAASGLEARRAPELCTVYYRFIPWEEPEDELPPTSEPPSSNGSQYPRLPGLLRWEKDFETPEAPRSSRSGSGPFEDASTDLFGTGQAGVSSSRMSPGESSLPELYARLEAAFGPKVLYLPEVVEFELRYFDGQAWTSSWDSLSRQALPVAIEARFRIDVTMGEGRGKLIFPVGEGAQSHLGGQIDGVESGRGGGELFRIVIEIPGSPHFQGPRAPVRPETDQPRVGPRPPFLPRPIPLVRPIEPTRPLAPSDQWMRVSP